MVRIKGANSDYKYSAGKVEKVEPQPEKVYLKLFICPYDQPSSVEPNEGNCCNGIDRTCPNQGKKQGHALIQLHQEDGIQLVTDNNNQIVINQQGNIELIPSPGGQAEVNGALMVKQQDELLLEISNQTISLQLGGAKISLTPAGKIEISTPKQQGEVKINGNLTIQGNLTVTGKIIGDFDLSKANVSLSEASLTAISEEVKKRLQQS
ncbi:hypothetical protein NIES3806_39220 [Microcystis aeruginosa NIES-3806]|uniref:hypothetical protein n=1 Tax=Microcystis aeruginosa TaxID=1126 RepID=UPI001305736D|nr:hypothetical protein [Microcystis aeruginosa]GCL56560.1 hypothetical protein NIES3806_39220 [Microcystis aeruginosa NIES-3806]